ncbi:putative proteasome activator subunit 4 [Xylona heveae TC161]|uniref:Putative proteasome activator subunit 4 n=1 Tax=Xylona heveae (strain CBS 132557 / TC161) TaxID=1328760 RepID=A0A165IJ09_XYLHT|nr:putative proteasome activator subunit 4 [Xylona heveae TC161]KZF24962.1 putative proteasome activator subunit 4 [Xylona heveae TC161]
MEAGRVADLISAHSAAMTNDISRATSPGAGWREGNGANGYEPDKVARSRPRTFPYFRYLPYAVEDDAEREATLDEIIKQLFMAVEAGDFSPGAVHWTRELRSWLGLKFDPRRSTRIKLVRLYYELALAPGIDPNVVERFASMFMILTKRKHYLRPGVDLKLDWRPLYKELKVFVLPSQSGMVHTTTIKRSIRTLTKLCAFSQLYFDPREIPAMLEEFLPYFTTSFPEGGYVVVGLLNLLMPTTPAPAEDEKLQPQNYLPTFFHLWSLVNRSRTFDINFLDILSRLARDSLPAKHIPFSEYGIFTKEQSTLIFTAILRLLEIPVGQSTSPYSAVVDLSAGLALMLDRDQRKHPIAHHIARWIVMSLSPKCLEQEHSVLSCLEGLIEAVETFFHPSNSGVWTKTLAQLVYYLADFFVMRWNRETSGETELPEERRLNEPLKRRFVLCLRDVIFMGIYAKSGTAMNFSLSTLQSLAFLEPNLILPGALQRIYPSIQGLVEVHRTTSSLRSLQILSKIMVRTKGFRCHITTLLGLALPGIDANDLEKTLHTLSFVQSVCYNIPFCDMTKDDDEINGSALAVQWITSEVERMEIEGVNVQMDYENALSDEDEAMILRSSTAGFGEFLISFLGRVFTLLENLPDASRVRSGSPEENVVNTLPATFTPLLASLSPELYDLALGKIADFVANHVIHQARDAMAFICNALCKVNPKKALKRLVPVLVQAIRSEIDENGAASTRNTGSDVLPRDRGLVWHVSMLSMCVVHVGDAVLDHKKQLFDIALYMQSKCKGIPTVHVSNYIHHLLLNLTVTYTLDYSLYEPDVLSRGLCIDDWGQSPKPDELTISWHVPNREELEFAVELFQSQAESALYHLSSLTSDDSPIKRDGTGKEWSDEVSRNLVLLRLILSGISMLFDHKAASRYGKEESPLVNGGADALATAEDDNQDLDEEEVVLGDDDEVVKPTFQYPAGYPLHDDDPLHSVIHDLRERTGRLLHSVHRFLCEKQEDDVSCFTALYTAYRSWFIDVGIERSAHVLDRVTRLLAADIHPYKVSGLRKEYPRPLLLRRANVYHLQRLRHNASPRPKSELDKVLLLDLAESSVSLYTDIRRNAQSAGESAVKVLIGARPLVIPPLLSALEEAVEKNDFPRIKGAIYSLLFGSLARTVSRDWRFTPSLIRSFIAISSVDKPSIQKLSAGATYQVMEFGRPSERMVILDEAIVKAIAPPSYESLAPKIAKKKKFVETRRGRVEAKKAELAGELTKLARESHWKKASRTAAIIINLGLRFDTIASEDMVDLVTRGTIDSHPGLRGLYSGALVALFSLVEMRALCNHSYEKYLLEEHEIPSKVEIPTRRDDLNWTKEYLAGFAQPNAQFYVDHDYPGWLVWDKSMPAYRASPKKLVEYDQVEMKVRTQMGKILTRDWFKTFFNYLKQEPRDSGADRFRMASAMMLLYAFGLLIDNLTAASFEDIQEEVKEVFDDGSDKHQHRATAEILGALLTSVTDHPLETRTKVWEYAFPIVRKIFTDGITPENASYWTTFLHLLLQGRDPRRAWPIVDWLSSFRLDMNSNAAFKESSKIQLLQQCIIDAGWHFQLEKPILEDFLAHLDHPYKGVREAMGQTLASIYRTRYHESHRTIEELMQHEKAVSSIGSRPYQPSKDFTDTMEAVFGRLEKWRKERPAGQQTPSSYTSGSKTVLLWLDATLSSHECTQLLQFFPTLFTEQLLHMMDIKEDPELQSLAYHVFRHLPNIPHRSGEDTDFVKELIRIGTTSPLWHQRLRVLINMQVVYFRRLFLISPADQQALFDCVSAMLEDPQLEVRLGASTTLSGMIRCSPVYLRTRIVHQLKKKFTNMLQSSRPPKRSGVGTPTPEQTKAVLFRHAAVLGLGALVQAFPYMSPPPAWLPEVLATIAVKAAADAGTVGKSVKSILSDFKKTRQDTWHVDVKVFSPEQLEDLEGVLWKSYFA